MNELAINNQNPLIINSELIHSGENNLDLRPRSNYIVDKVIEWGQLRLFNDPEKGLRKGYRVITLLDNSLFAVVGFVQVAAFLDALFHINLDAIKEWTKLVLFLRIIAVPITIFFLAFAVFEGAVESIQLSWTWRLQKNLTNTERSTLDKMKWIERHYFAISKKQEKKIERFIENNGLQGEAKEKALNKFHATALDIKYRSLKQRLNKQLAERIRTELPDLLKGMQSSNSEIQKAATEKGDLLLNAIVKRADKVIAIHIIALSALLLTAISMLGLLTGFASPLVVTILAASTLGLMVIRHIASRVL